MTKKSGTYHHGDLRASLLAETAAMIAAGGVASVTMRELSRRLGVSRAAPYRHFPDKSSLLLAVAAQGFERLQTRLREVDAAAPPASGERLRRMGEAYLRFALENPAQYRLMYGKEALERGDRPELGEAANELFALLGEVIRALQRAGAIKRGNVEAQAYSAWGAVHGLASLLIEGQIDPSVELDALIRASTRTLLDGLRVRRRAGTEAGA